jgi:hypothetical protein
LPLREHTGTLYTAIGNLREGGASDTLTGAGLLVFEASAECIRGPSNGFFERSGRTKYL